MKNELEKFIAAIVLMTSIVIAIILLLTVFSIKDCEYNPSGFHNYKHTVK